MPWSHHSIEQERKSKQFRSRIPFQNFAAVHPKFGAQCHYEIKSMKATLEIFIQAFIDVRDWG